jgi:hypothetical protein
MRVRGTKKQQAALCFLGFHIEPEDGDSTFLSDGENFY